MGCHSFGCAYADDDLRTRDIPREGLAVMKLGCFLSGCGFAIWWAGVDELPGDESRVGSDAGWTCLRRRLGCGATPAAQVFYPEK